MKKLVGILVLGFFVYLNPASSNEKLINSLKEGGKLIFIRHAYAPGNGDPKDFSLKICSSQRNLAQEGINQSKNIGLFFTKNNIQVDKVYLANGAGVKIQQNMHLIIIKLLMALNSFYDSRFAKNKEKQIKDLKKYISSWNSKKNLVLITHFVVISEALNVEARSGEIIVSDRNFNIINSIEIN